MSLGYAEKLSFREDLGGQLGSQELSESSEDLTQKIQQLITMVHESKRIVAYTGAGISTACGIPDFRGPKGVWTMQRAGQPIPQAAITFAAAKPSLTHQALVGLANEGRLKYIVSQNVDSLHLRSGIPRQKLAELHGNCFAERCSKCRHEYIRDFEIETVGFKATKRRCSQPGCKGLLRDHTLDWEDALPADELAESERQSSRADLAICLGTSLQITPACNLPLRTVKAGGKLVIVNLQQTPKDKKATLVIHAKCDDIMRRVMEGLQLAIPAYVRTDTVLLRCQQAVNPAAKSSSERRVTVEVCNAHDPKAVIAIVASAYICVAQGEEKVIAADLPRAPFAVTFDLDLPAELSVSCSLTLTEAADADKRHVSFSTRVPVNVASRRSQNACFSSAFSFITQEVHHEDPSHTADDSVKGEAGEQIAKRFKVATSHC